MLIKYFFQLLGIFLVSSYTTAEESEDEKVRLWIQNEYNVQGEQLYSAWTKAGYENDINPSDANRQKLDAASQRYHNFAKTVQQKAKSFDVQKMADPQFKRQVKMILRETRLYSNATIDQLVANMKSNLTSLNVNIAANGNAEQRLNYFDMDGFFANPDNGYDKLHHAWNAIHTAVGRAVRPLYEQYVPLQNEQSRAMGYRNRADVLFEKFENENFPENMEPLLHDLLPLYEQLHAYVGRQLRSRHPGHNDPKTIPAHLFGNIKVSQWVGIAEMTKPFKDVTASDLTRMMQEKNYTVEKMIGDIEEFFRSVGFNVLSPENRRRSYFEKTAGMNYRCGLGAYDFKNGRDMAIVRCTTVTQFEFLTAILDYGFAIQFTLNSHKPYIFRAVSADGLSGLVGLVSAMAFFTPTHLRHIGLIGAADPTYHERINAMYKEAMQFVPYLQWLYIMDLWRKRVFDGTYPSSTWNTEWWNLRKKYQGIHSPIASDDESRLDAAAASPVVQDSEVMTYFIAVVLKYQFYEQMCLRAGHSGALDACDFHGSSAAGNVMKDLYYPSAPTNTILRNVFGGKGMSTEAMMKYFEPLMNWLKNENANADACYGWGETWPENVMRKLEAKRC